MRALSGATRQLSQRESLWHVGQLSSGRAKHDVSGTVVRCCQDSRQLDKVRCPEAAGLCSKARPFAPYRASGVQLRVARPAKASPFGRGVTEGDGEGKDADGELKTQRWYRSDKEFAYRCAEALSSRACPLRRFAPALPGGEPLAGVDGTARLLYTNHRNPPVFR